MTQKFLKDKTKSALQIYFDVTFSMKYLYFVVNGFKVWTCKVNLTSNSHLNIAANSTRAFMLLVNR